MYIILIIKLKCHRKVVILLEKIKLILLQKIVKFNFSSKNINNITYKFLWQLIL